MRTTPRSNSTRINGINHHFFSRAQKRRNSLNTAHMDGRILSISAASCNSKAAGPKTKLAFRTHFVFHTAYGGTMTAGCLRQTPSERRDAAGLSPFQGNQGSRRETDLLSAAEANHVCLCGSLLTSAI